MRAAVAYPLLLAVAAATDAGCDTRYHLAGTRGTGTGTGAVGDGGQADGAPRADVGTGGAAGSSGGSGGSAGGAPAIPTPPAPAALTITARDAVTRVARVLWESQPDAALLAMADSGAIMTDADLRGVARAMLNDPRARPAVGHFYRWWMDLDRLAYVEKDRSKYPQYSATLADLMATETETFGTAVTLDEDGRFGTLMRASHTYINETLAPFYGVTGVTGLSVRAVDLDPRWRAGILTLLAQQARTSGQSSTSPTRRGLSIRQRVLCDAIEPPPPGIVTTLPPLDPTPKTTRQLIEAETMRDDTCARCHSLMDQVGFAYEVFDAIGAARLTDNGLPIDATGRLVATAEHPELTFDGPVELAQLLATLPQAHRCIATQALAYVLGQPVDDAAELASAKEVYAHFAAAGLDLRVLFAAAVSSPRFLDPEGGTVCTPGLDQTCNDSPFVSAIYGTCTAAGKCVCDPSRGRVLNLATGRCQ